MHALDRMPAPKDPFAKVGGHLRRQGRRRSPASGGAGDRPRLDLLGRTKAELLVLARGLGLRGRSRMTKAELVRAITRAR